MEVSTATNVFTAGLTRSTSAASLNSSIRTASGNENTEQPNAFGIGKENQPEVELSPQARVLQQTDQNQRELRDGLEERRQEARESQEQEQTQADGFVRLSTSEGNVSRNNLEAEKAAEVYRTIQNLV